MRKNFDGRDCSIGDAKAAKTVNANPTKMNMNSTDSLDTRTADGDGTITSISGGVSVPFPSPGDNISSVSWSVGGETNAFGNHMISNSEDVCQHPASAIVNSRDNNSSKYFHIRVRVLVQC
jgi:hypothetical protein